MVLHMSSSRYIISRPASLHFAILGWLSLWMLVIPFIHIHAEVAHDHGEQGHVHKAVTHSIFSDLPGEFEESTHTQDSPDLNKVPTGPPEHLEIAFTSLFLASTQQLYTIEQLSLLDK